MKTTSKLKMLGMMAALLCLVPVAAQAVPVEWGYSIVQNTTWSSATDAPWDPATYLGAPDKSNAGIYGLGYGTVTYDFGYVENLPGADFNIYEGQNGLSEFYLMQVYVSANSLTWYNVTGTQGSALSFDGYPVYPNDPYGTPLVFSYSIPDNPDVDWIRYIRLVGTGTNGQIVGTIGCGFDLNAVGVDLPPAAVPEPGTLLLLGAGILGLGLMRKRKA